MEDHTPSLLPAVLAALLAGLGTLLASEEKLTWRIVLGRALSSAALGAAAGVVLLWFPHAPTAALVGLAAALASLGTSGLEKLLQIILKK
ncbi:MAG: hypothetical protein EA357_10650 [Micavibrio sp.]|nr:MAG: hypothetical protein EA357_10650 [Micavibrio sp.]